MRGTWGSGWRRRAVVAALVTGLVVAGCSGGDEPDEPAAQPVTSIPEGRLPEPVPVMPAAAREHTLDGAEAMFRYYLDVYEYAFHTSDTRVLKPLGAADCGFCSLLVDAFDRNRKSGFTGRDGRFSVSSPKPMWMERDVSAVVSARVHRDALHMVHEEGKPGNTAPPEDMSMEMQLDWIPEASVWRVASVVAK